MVVRGREVVGNRCVSLGNQKWLDDFAFSGFACL